MAERLSSKFHSCPPKLRFSANCSFLGQTVKGYACMCVGGGGGGKGFLYVDMLYTDCLLLGV